MGTATRPRFPIGTRDGNRDPAAVPHGSYPCRNDEWCVISCWDEEEWQRLSQAADEPAWLADPRFSSFAERKKNEKALNAAIREWTRERDAHWIMYHLQKFEIHAAVVNTMRDLFSDPQIAFRDIWQEFEHPEIGPHHYRMVSYRLSDTPGSVRGPAPCLGEHNAHVFLDLISLSEDEYHRLSEQGAFS